MRRNERCSQKYYNELFCTQTKNKAQKQCVKCKINETEESEDEMHALIRLSLSHPHF